jgi:hypothetical protein
MAQSAHWRTWRPFVSNTGCYRRKAVKIARLIFGGYAHLYLPLDDAEIVVRVAADKQAEAGVSGLSRPHLPLLVQTSWGVPRLGVRRISSVSVSTRIVSSIVIRPRQSRPSGRGPCAGRGGCIACDRNVRGGVRSTCSQAAEERCDMAERKRGLVRWRWRKMRPR